MRAPRAKIYEFAPHTLINLSVTDRDMRRIDESYGIAYSDDIDAALAILNRIAAEEPRVLKDPAPLIAVEKLADSSVNILFQVWTARTDWSDTKRALLKRCKEELEKGGCSLPLPQREVQVRSASAAAGQPN